MVNRAIEACEKDQQQKFIDIITSSRAELVSCELANFALNISYLHHLQCFYFLPRFVSRQAKSPYAKYVLQRIDKAASEVPKQQEKIQE